MKTLKVFYWTTLGAFLIGLAYSAFAFISASSCNFGGCGLAAFIVFLLSAGITSVLGMVFLLVRIFKLRAEGKRSTWSKMALIIPFGVLAYVVWIFFGPIIQQEAAGDAFIGVEDQSVVEVIDKVVEVKWSKLPNGTLVVVNHKPEYANSCSPTDPGVVGSLPIRNRSQYTRKSIPVTGSVSTQERYVVRLCSQEKIIESNEFRFFSVASD